MERVEKLISGLPFKSKIDKETVAVCFGKPSVWEIREDDFHLVQFYYTIDFGHFIIMMYERQGEFLYIVNTLDDNGCKVEVTDEILADLFLAQVATGILKELKSRHGN